MRWDDFRRSDNVEDARGDGGGGGGGFGLPIGGGGLGIGTIIVLGLVGWALGIDPRILIGGAEIVMGGAPATSGQSSGRPAPAQRTAERREPASSSPPCSAIPRTPGRKFSAQAGQTLSAATAACCSAVPFRAACGFAQAAMGPFYCPNDQRIYLDTSFFRDIERRFRGCTGKACEFAQAYVIAHEVGHHVQNLLGILPRAQRRSRRQAAGRRPTASRCGSSCRPIASPASGRTTPSKKWQIHRAGRHRGGAADRGRDRRRPAAEAHAGHGGAGRLHPRLLGSSASAGS